MKILYDHLCFWQKYGGVPRYYVELMKRIPPDNYVTTVKFSNNEYLKELKGIKYHSFLDNIQFRGKARLESEVGKLYSIPILLRGNFDIYHQTHYDTYAFKYLPKNKAKVTTIHDMNYYAIPSYYPANLYLKDQMEKSIKLADRIITVSNNSKFDLCNYLKVPEQKIAVIYHGVDIDRIRSIEEVKSHDVPPYILFVGARNSYKNFERLIDAFVIVRQKYPGLKLYCAGKKPTKLEMEFLRSKKVDSDVCFFQASDHQLILLYKHALAFVFPSLYEGFGLPILEAMASGCPVVISNTSCFPEIAQDAASYFSPTDVGSIADAIVYVLDDSTYRDDLVKKGRKRAENFTWDKSVERHMEVYRSLL